VTKFDWTRDDDDTVTLDENKDCVKVGTKGAAAKLVKKGCTFRFAVVRNFD